MKCPWSCSRNLCLVVQREHVAPNTLDLPRLYSSGVATNPLNEGSHLTVLQALVRYFTWFWEHPERVKVLFLPCCPCSTAILTTRKQFTSLWCCFEPFLVKPIVYHVCPTDCIVFMGQHAQLSECPKCGASRYISENSATPLRTFTYLPVGPRLIRYFGTANIAKIL